MNETRAYFPLFPSMDKITEELSNEDIGVIIRAIWRGVPTDKRPEEYTVLQFMAYKMLVDSAERVWNSLRKKPSYNQGGKQSAPKNHYQPDGSDPEEALRLALERSFGEEEGDE